LIQRLLALPALVYILAIWIAPTLALTFMSFRRRSIYGGFEEGWSPQAWLRVVEGDTLKVVVRTTGLSFTTTLCCLVLGYFLVSLAVRLPRAGQYILMLLFVLPVGVDMLVKVFGWSSLLGPTGFLARLADWVGEDPLAGVAPGVKLVAVFVIVYLPLALLPVWVAVRQIDPSLERAARDSGATALQAYLLIILPLSKKGTAVAILLVWVSSLTNFLIPDLVGGAKTYYLGNLIKQQFFEARNWPLGAALGILALVLSLLGLALLTWATGFKGLGTTFRRPLSRPES
jgi:spermidine/putrescine transport system permease protein